MIRINQIKMPIEHSETALLEKAAKLLKIKKEQITELVIQKKSIDARKKPELHIVYSVNVLVDNEKNVLKKINDKNIMLISERAYKIPESGKTPLTGRPVIIGAGPAGLFCAYLLAIKGYKPLLLERGKSVLERQKDVEQFWETGILNTASNVQFGEGGAGTFSDGKLNTLVKDSFGRNRFVLETFVKFGAQEAILYENKPHIGTDVLQNVILRMRQEIEKLGGTVRFQSHVTDIKIINNQLAGVQINRQEWLETEVCVLAVGHSARDTFELLEKKGLEMCAKAFAVGFRVEHPQADINRIQYGALYEKKLPAAPYKVTANLENGRGVYSFCMCPGGYVVNASSEKGRLAVNGMSYADRGSKNANSAIIVSVTPDDFDGTDALSGVRFQRELEENAFALADGKIPQQLFQDYCKNQPSVSYGKYVSMHKGQAALTNLRGILPETLEQAFIEGMRLFSRSVSGFAREDAILSAIESRTSSPVRIKRDAEFESNKRGIYPCGEGAGYAGGIMSAAMDGIKVAEAILKKYGRVEWEEKARG